MYKTVVGLELHAELNTNSKMFSRSKNEYNEIPNINVTPLDMALPGTLPLVNKNGVKKGIKLALCLDCKIPEYLKFDRKNYYYPDLPKGYQITQNHEPIGTKGKIKFESEGEVKEVTIHDIHLEEDTASLDHFSDYSLINYNRCGVPLIEIVTDPCIYSAKMAVNFLEYMISILRYCNLSEADTKKGQIRCDVNVNLKNDKNEYVTPKVEVKNVNSIANVEAAILYEVKRQTEALENHETLTQETRRFDEETGTTIKMRSKEDAIDYKYFIEPNIPFIKIDKDWIETIKKEIPMLPLERKKHYINDLSLNEKDATILIKDINIANYYEKCIDLKLDAKISANWIISEITSVLNKEAISINDFYITPNRLKIILEALTKGNISSKQAKEVFYECLNKKIEPETLLKDTTQLSDENELLNIINTILDNNSTLILEYKNGRNNVFDFFVGQVMKETRGKANPVLTKEILLKELNKR